MKKIISILFVLVLLMSMLAYPCFADSEESLVDEYLSDSYVTAYLYLDDTNIDAPEIRICVTAKEKAEAYFKVEYEIDVPVGPNLTGTMEVNATNLQSLSKSMSVLHSATPEEDVFEIVSIQATPVDMGPFLVTLVSSDHTIGAVYFYDEASGTTINTNEEGEGEEGEGEDEYVDPHAEILYGTTVTIQAKPFTGYSFAGWYFDGKLISRLKKYTFTCKGEAEFLAKFIEIQEHEHVYEEPLFEWNKTYTECNMFITCQMGDSSEKIPCEISSKITKEATKTTDGEKVLTAKASFNGNNYSNKVILTIPKYGGEEDPVIVDDTKQGTKIPKSALLTVGIIFLVGAWVAVIFVLGKKGKLVKIVKKK